MDTTQIIGLVLLLVIWGFFFVIAFIQYCQCTEGTERLVTLNVRTALFLPLYSLALFLAIVKPNALAGLNIFITFVEGYSFFCFYNLIVYNLGGPLKAVEAFEKADKNLICCNATCPKDGKTFYKRTVWALFHFLVTRTIIITGSTIASYGARNEKVGRAVSAILSLVATVILFVALIHIVLFCKLSRYVCVFNLTLHFT